MSGKFVCVTVKCMVNRSFCRIMPSWHSCLCSSAVCAARSFLLSSDAGSDLDVIQLTILASAEHALSAGQHCAFRCRQHKLRGTSDKLNKAFNTMRDNNANRDFNHCQGLENVSGNVLSGIDTPSPVMLRWCTLCRCRTTSWVTWSMGKAMCRQL